MTRLIEPMRNLSAGAESAEGNVSRNKGIP